MSPKEIFSQLSLLILKSCNILPLIYPIPVFTYVDQDSDPYSEYESGSLKVLNMDSNCIRIHNTVL